MSRAGRDYYSLIARAVEGLKGGTRAYRLAIYQRARTAQLNSFEPEISEVEFRRERNALEQAIRKVETEAATADDEQAKKDSKIVSDYATFLEKTTTRPDCFYDASALPHSKETIIAAIEREIVRSTFEEDVDWLRRSAAFMWNFLEGIGPDPLPFSGVDTSQSPRGRASDEPPDELRRIIASPDVERSATFLAIAEEESNEVEARVAAAIAMRTAMHGGD